jgi:hypothetical protein
VEVMVLVPKGFVGNGRKLFEVTVVRRTKTVHEVVLVVWGQE